MQRPSGYHRLESEDLKALSELVGKTNISTEESELLVNAVDALAGSGSKPEAVVWPKSADEVSRILRYCNEHRIPLTPRGAGSSLSGNAVPIRGGVVLSLRRMDKVIEIFEKDFQVRVQPGVVYDNLNEALIPLGLSFPPDPGSSSVCTIGGMVANNASGLGAVRYGVTGDYVLGLQVVLPDGQVINVGSRPTKSSTGYDLTRLFVGSEGTLGVVTEITLKLRALPRFKRTCVAYFASAPSATETVSEMIAKGLNPAAVEFLDRETIAAVNQAKSKRFLAREAMLLVEFHGSEDSTRTDMDAAKEICTEHGAADIHEAKDEHERHELWAARKTAYPSLLRLAPHCIIGDIVVPISRVTEMLESIYDISVKNQVKVACFGHAGDGNIHPNMLGDRADKDLWARVVKTNEEIVQRAIELGGVASGEHGIGIEKKEFMTLEHGDSLRLMKQIKRLVDPENIMNPGKFFDL